MNILIMTSKYQVYNCIKCKEHGYGIPVHLYSPSASLWWVTLALASLTFRLFLAICLNVVLTVHRSKELINQICLMTV